MTYFHVPGIGREGAFNRGEHGWHGADAPGYVPVRSGDFVTIDTKGPKPRRYCVREITYYTDARGRAETGLHVFLEKIEGEEYDYY